MNKLITELQRLYFLPDQQWQSQTLDERGELVFYAEGQLTAEIVAVSLAGEKSIGLNLVSPDGMVRTMVVDFQRAGDWDQVAMLHQAVQDDLNFPAPAVSVSGQKGYGLWFSLAESVPAVQARAFLNALQRRYLANIPAPSLRLRPDAGQPAAAAQTISSLPPALHMATLKWSTFIDPTMGGMFVDGPWLEMAPNMDKQADMMMGLKSIKAADFQEALIILQTRTATAANFDLPCVEPTAETATRPRRGSTRLNVGNGFSDPQSFLLAVMNDPSASARQRIAAAKALLSRFPVKIEGKH